MPIPGHQWYHIVFNTRGSWLPGDPRGFRSRNHRKHSSGHYKQPPPPGEHAGLYKHIRERATHPITIPEDLFTVIGHAVLKKAESEGRRVLAISVDAHHVHLLAELPALRRDAKQVVGTWKQLASHTARDRLPGKIWSKSCDPLVIHDERHQRNVFHYILAHATQGAWVWSFRDARGDQAEKRADG